MRTGFLSILKSNTLVDIAGDFDGGGSGSDELFRIYHSNMPANRLLTVLRDGKTGINIVTPLTLLHVCGGDSTTVPEANSYLTVESAGETNITILSAQSQQMHIYFKDSNSKGFIRYDAQTDAFSFHPNSIETIQLTSTLMTFKDALNVVLNTTTGTKFGTASNQKIAFLGATPIIQQAYQAISNPPTQAEVTAIRDLLVNFGFMAGPA